MTKEERKSRKLERELQELVSTTLTERKFKRWLSTQPDNRIVGRRGDSDSCPIATYLHQATATKHLLLGVSMDYVYYNIPNAGELPTVVTARVLPWAELFIDRVDNHTKASNITAKRARAILNEV